MDNEFNTLELAKTYEEQGYYEDAQQILDSLERQGPGTNPERLALAQKVKTAMASQTIPDPGEPLPDKNDPEQRVAHLLEQWVALVVLEKRLDVFKKIQSRC